MKFAMFGMSSALLAAVVLLAGCAGAVERPKEMEPEPEPEPSVLGVWRSVSGWYHDDQHVGVRHHTLMFTADRAIEVVEHVCDAGVAACPADARDHAWSHASGWSVDGSTITRTWVEEEDDELVTYATRKSFHFVGMDELYINPPWDHDEGSSSHDRDYRRYSRAAPPSAEQMLVLVVGVWTSTYTGDRRGSPAVWSYTVTITPDGSFEYIVDLDSEDDAQDLVYRTSGTYTFDPVGMYILVSFLEAALFEQGQPEDLRAADRALIGNTFRWGVAPTGSLNKVALSPFWSEHQWDDEQMEWLDENMYSPYGRYWMILDKQQS